MKKIKNPEILLDQDGVVCNLVKQMCRYHNKPYEPEKFTFFEFSFGMTKEEFWEPMQGLDFWVTAEPYPWAKELYTQLSQIAPVTICTAPSRDVWCPTGKMIWLRDVLGITTPNIVIANKKHMLAKFNRILIDDGEHKTLPFEEHGGTSILFPQPWNNATGTWVDVVERVKMIVG
jgi:5'(3')-deoxyribonucleotidase